MGNDKKSWVGKFLSRIIGHVKELAGGLLAIGSLIAVIAASYKNLSVPAEQMQSVLVAANFIVLVLYCLAARRVPKLNLKKGPDKEPSEATLYCTLFNISIKGSQEGLAIAKRKETRVNILVKQLHTNIRWYAIFLIIVYVVYVFDNKTVLEGMLHLPRGFYEGVHPYFSMAVGICNYLSAVFIFLAFKVLYNKTVADDDVTPLTYYGAEFAISTLIIIGYIVFSGSLAPLSNVQTKTPLDSLREIKKSIQQYEEQINNQESKRQDEINRQKESKKQDESKTGSANNGNNAAPASPQNTNTNWLESFYEKKESTASFDRQYYKEASTELDKVEDIIDKTNTSSILMNRLQLFIGSLNGLAMALLFGRYVSMEQTAYDLKEGEYAEREYKNFIHVCTICILPIYAIAQPLFGLFEIRAFGDPGDFANFVFFVCLIGKIFFLYLTYILMKHRLTHLYLHSVITNQGVPKDKKAKDEDTKEQGIFKCFNSDF